jgi:DNA-binding IclR family transcriptional regulator
MTVTAGEERRAPGKATRIQSVARASQMLLWVARQPHGATAKEVATAQGLRLSTTYHLLNTLADQGILTKGSGRRFVLGPGAALIAHAHMRGSQVSDVLLAGLREIARVTDETAYLADWGQYEIRVLASVEGRQLVRVAEVATGAYDHAHARANGKVLLAYAVPEVREAFLRTHPLVPVTRTTISSPHQFDRELQAIRDRGYAHDREEYAAGVSCVAVPIAFGGHVIAALGLSVPSARFASNQAELTTALLDVVAGLQLGSIAAAG